MAEKSDYWNYAEVIEGHYVKSAPLKRKYLNDPRRLDSKVEMLKKIETYKEWIDRTRF